ncbi:MAG: LysR family transcriptional regulator [Firmicutes bacterium]|nr:LysR family transcriptional regulator [Bacillota bacterium]
MNTFQLQCFLAVANTLSFAKAADRMSVSQPAITHQIKSLETELNVKLFRRSTRVVEMTLEGQAFLPDAKSIVVISEQAMLRFANSDDRPILTLAIGCNSDWLLSLLESSLSELNQQHQNFHPHLCVEQTERLFHLLETEMIDLVFDIREGQELKKGWEFHPLCSSRLACVCRRDAALPHPGNLSDLAQKKLIFCNPINVAPEINRLQRQLAEGKHPADIHFCDSAETACVLVGAGCGVAIVPELLVPANERIVSVPLEDAPSLSYGLFCKSSAKNDIVKQFIRIATSAFGARSAPE